MAELEHVDGRRRHSRFRRPQRAVILVIFGCDRAALSGVAVALADFAIVANDLAEGRLVQPFELGIRIPAEFAYFLVYPEQSANDPRILAFREWILGEALEIEQQERPLT